APDSPAPLRASTCARSARSATASIRARAARCSTARWTAAPRPRRRQPTPPGRAPRRGAAEASWTPQQVEELLALRALVEDAADRRGDGQRAGLLDAPHLDAKVARFDDHHRSLRAKGLLQIAHHLLGEPLLELRALGVELEDARELRQPENAAGRNVGDMGMAVES